MADDNFVNALARKYADMHSAGDLRNRLAGDPAWPTLPSPPDNRPSLRSYDPQAGRPMDWAERSGVGEGAGLSPLRGGAALGELVGHTRQDMADRDWGGAADMAPMVAGALFGFGRRPATSKLELKSDFGRITGIVDPSSKTVRAGGSFVNEDARGQGHGVALYQQLADKAAELGYVMHSDGPVSRDAARVYEALKRRGYDVQMHPDAYIDAYGHVGVRGGDPAANAYTVIPRTKETHDAIGFDSVNLAEPDPVEMAMGLLGPGGRASLALSRNLQPMLRPDRLTTPEGHPQFYYHILQDGQKIGSATGHVSGDTAHVGWLGATGLENTLGTSGIKQLRDAFRRDFPEVNTFSGDRSSGARAPDLGSKMQADRKQTVRFDDGSDQ